MRPATLSDLVGQEHLTGEGGALTRLTRTGTIGSLILWGPPGTGKTTVARLLANETELAFEQVSAIQPETSGATPSHRKPITAANTSVLPGVGADEKYQVSASERTV